MCTDRAAILNAIKTMLEMAMRRKGRNETSMLDTVGKATETESGYAAHNKRGVEASDQRELCWRKNKNKICINISISARVPFQATASFKHELQNNNNNKTVGWMHRRRAMTASPKRTRREGTTTIAFCVALNHQKIPLKARLLSELIQRCDDATV